jgi:hypothetical protein
VLITTKERSKRRRTIVVAFSRIPLARNTTERKHWGVRKREVDLWTVQVPASLEPGERHVLRRNAERTPPGLITIRSVFLHRRKIYDPDGAVGALKYVLDGMVRARLLDDDTERNVSIIPPIQFQNCGPGMILCLSWTG